MKNKVFNKISEKVTNNISYNAQAKCQRLESFFGQVKMEDTVE